MSHCSARPNRPHRTPAFALCLIAALLAAPIVEARSKESPRVDVTAAYIELRSGPGRGYPVFHTIERGHEMSLVKRRTDWYRVRTDRGVEGWVNRRELESGTGDPALQSLRDTAMDDYLERRV
ncbi:MAG: SH3 domain-containing protein, partial [Gammaproteobacteria bacterium]